jgi:pimeloyl-ACP methyl ester carboxylesterase
MTSPKRTPVLLGLAAAALLLGGCAAIVDKRATTRENAFEAQFPPTGQLLQVNGTTVHADVRGKGPDLILIHGASGNTRDFTFDLVDRLTDHYRVISFARPGLGWPDTIGDQTDNPIAQAELLRAAAQQLDVKNPIILGHSYGGAVTMAWALRDPSGPAALVLVSGATYPWPGELSGWYNFINSSVGEHTAVPLITAFAPESRVDEIVAGIFAPQDPPEGYVDYIGAGLSARRASLSANSKQVGHLKPYLVQMAPHYPELTMPIEIVHGDADDTVYLDVHSGRMARELPNAHLTVLPGVGHMPHHADPQAVVDAIDRAAERAGVR